MADEIADLDELISEITTDAHGEDEQTWSFLAALEELVELSADAHVIGRPVEVTEFGYDGNVLRGIEAHCVVGHDVYELAAVDVVFPQNSRPAGIIAAYRKWIGLKPWSVHAVAPPERAHKATEDDIQPGENVELEIISIASNFTNARCRVAGTGREVTLKSSDVWGRKPGDIVTVMLRNFWTFAGHPYVSGDIESSPIDG